MNDSSLPVLTMHTNWVGTLLMMKCVSRTKRNIVICSFGSKKATSSPSSLVLAATERNCLGACIRLLIVWNDVFSSLHQLLIYYYFYIIICICTVASFWVVALIQERGKKKRQRLYFPNSRRRSSTSTLWRGSPSQGISRDLIQYQHVRAHKSTSVTKNGGCSSWWWWIWFAARTGTKELTFTVQK